MIFSHVKLFCLPVTILEKRARDTVPVTQNLARENFQKIKFSSANFVEIVDFSKYKYSADFLFGAGKGE